MDRIAIANELVKLAKELVVGKDEDWLQLDPSNKKEMKEWQQLADALNKQVGSKLTLHDCDVWLESDDDKFENAVKKLYKKIFKNNANKVREDLIQAAVEIDALFIMLNVKASKGPNYKVAKKILDEWAEISNIRL